MGIDATLTLKIVKKNPEKGESTPGYLLFKRVQAFLEMIARREGVQGPVRCSFKYDTDFANGELSSESEAAFEIYDRNFWFEKYAVRFLTGRKHAETSEEFFAQATESETWEKDMMDFCKEFDCTIDYVCGTWVPGGTCNSLLITKDKITEREPTEFLEWVKEAEKDLEEICKGDETGLDIEALVNSQTASSDGDDFPF